MQTTDSKLTVLHHFLKNCRWICKTEIFEDILVDRVEERAVGNCQFHFFHREFVVEVADIVRGFLTKLFIKE